MSCDRYLGTVLVKIAWGLQAGSGNALPAKIFSVNLDDLYIQGDKAN